MQAPALHDWLLEHDVQASPNRPHARSSFPSRTGLSSRSSPSDRSPKNTAGARSWTLRGGARSVLDGDGANGTSAFVGSPTRIATGQGNTLFIWDGQNSRIRVLDLTTGVIDAWARFQAALNVNCSPTVPFTTGFPQPKRFISFNAAGTAYVWAFACSVARNAIIEVPPSGPASVWAMLPFVVEGSRPFDLFFELSGDALGVDAAGARVFRIDAQTRTSTVILGTGSGSGDTPDWSPASMTGITPPTSLAPLPRGRFVVVTGETLRTVW